MTAADAAAPKPSRIALYTCCRALWQQRRPLAKRKMVFFMVDRSFFLHHHRHSRSNGLPTLNAAATTTTIRSFVEYEILHGLNLNFCFNFFLFLMFIKFKMKFIYPLYMLKLKSLKRAHKKRISLFIAQMCEIEINKLLNIEIIYFYNGMLLVTFIFYARIKRK